MINKLIKDLLKIFIAEFKNEEIKKIMENDIINPLFIVFLKKFKSFLYPYIIIIFTFFFFNLLLIIIILILIIFNNKKNI